MEIQSWMRPKNLTLIQEEDEYNIENNQATIIQNNHGDFNLQKGYLHKKYNSNLNGSP
jgi:hypothetical protein